MYPCRAIIFNTSLPRTIYILYTHNVLGKKTVKHKSEASKNYKLNAVWTNVWGYSGNITLGFFAHSSEIHIHVQYVQDFHQMGQTAGSRHDLLLSRLIYTCHNAAAIGFWGVSAGMYRPVRCLYFFKTSTQPLQTQQEIWVASLLCIFSWHLGTLLNMIHSLCNHLQFLL